MKFSWVRPPRKRLVVLIFNACNVAFLWLWVVRRSPVIPTNHDTSQLLPAEPRAPKTLHGTRIDPKNFHPVDTDSVIVETVDCPAQELGLRWMEGVNQDNGPCGKQELQAYRNRTDFHFLGLGVQKGGTTTLNQRLVSHPAMFMSNTKETRYFLEGGLDEVEPSAAKKDYMSKFWWSIEEIDLGKRRGEITPEYQAWPPTPPRVLSILGNPLRFMIILREPAARAYSFYQMHKRLSLTNKKIRKKKKIRETFELTIEKEYLLLQDCISGGRRGADFNAGGVHAGTDDRMPATIDPVHKSNEGVGEVKEGIRTEGVMNAKHSLEVEPSMQWEGEDMNWYRDCYLPRYPSEGSAKPGSGTVGPLGYGFYYFHLYHWFQVYPPCSFLILDHSELNIPNVDKCIWRFLDAHPLDFEIPVEKQNWEGKDGSWIQAHVYQKEDPMKEETMAMLREMYSPFVKRLENLLGRKFRSWGY